MDLSKKLITPKYKELFCTWYFPTTNKKDKEKKEEINFYPNGTYKSKKDNGFGILLETQGIYKIKNDSLYFKDSIYKFKISNGVLTLKTKKFLSKYKNFKTKYYIEYKTIKYSKLKNKLKSLDNTLHQMPKSYQECVDLLKIIVPSNLKEKLMQKDEEKDDYSFLTTGHFGLGMFIRNAFGLWGSNPYLNVRDPDSFSESVNNSFKEALLFEKYLGIEFINNFKKDPKTYSNGFFTFEDKNYKVFIKYVEEQEAFLLIIHDDKLRYYYIDHVIEMSYEDSILTLKDFIFSFKIHLNEKLDMSKIKIKTRKELDWM